MGKPKQNNNKMSKPRSANSYIFRVCEMPYGNLLVENGLFLLHRFQFTMSRTHVGLHAKHAFVICSLRHKGNLKTHQLLQSCGVCADISHVLNFHVLCISCIRDLSLMYILSCI